MPDIRLIVIAVVGVLGVAATLWVFVPVFQGPQAARRAVGTHRLAISSVLAVVVLNALITLPLVGVAHLDVEKLTAGTFAVAALSTDIPMLVVVYVRLRLPGAVTWAELGLRPLPPWYVLAVGVGAGVAGLVGVAIVGALLSQVGLSQNQLEEFAFVRTEGPLAFALLLFMASVVAPIVEELFFRGFLFGMYRRRQPLWVAYVASSLLFTLLHLMPGQMNLQQMAGLSVGIFLLALLLAWLYQRTGSLYPGMLAHAVNNATGLILFYAFRIS
jgi:membrane protease YdiL (CAAX protease family)